MKQITTLLLFCFLLLNCAQKQAEGKQQTTPNENIIGKWRNQEVSNGVEYYITFHRDHTISQVFVDATGRARLYGGRWGLSGDSLTIEDKGGVYHMLITEMEDSTMVMIRTDSMAVVFNRYPDAEGFLPEP